MQSTHHVSRTVDISVAAPAYNEAVNIAAAVTEWRDYLAQHPAIGAWLDRTIFTHAPCELDDVLDDRIVNTNPDNNTAHHEELFERHSGLKRAKIRWFSSE